MPFCWLQAFAACAVYDANFPIKKNETRALCLRRSLVELEDSGCAHIGDQVLRLSTQRIDLLRFLEVLWQHVPVRMILKLLNQPCNCLFAICPLDERRSEAIIDVTATSFLILRSVIFFEVLATRVLEM